MQRWTARLLLFLALAGTLAPPALQATGATPHQCCLRRQAHSCHKDAESQQTSVRGRGCCTQNSYHSVITRQWARNEARFLGRFERVTNPSGGAADSLPVVAEFEASWSSRAPPYVLCV